MSEIYAQHTMALYKIKFNAWQNADEIIDPSDVCGHDSLDLFCDFCTECSTPAQVEDSERFIGIKSYSKTMDYVFATISSGRAGMSVSVFDTQKQCDSGISYSEVMAGMVDSRILLRRTAGLGYALACVESVPNGAGVTTPLTMFKRFVNKMRMGATMRYERLEEAEALNAFSGIEEIELRRYLKPKDICDDSIINLGTVSHIMKHRQRVLMPLNLIRRIIDDKDVVAGYLGVSADFDGREDVLVRLRQKGGGSRLFSLDKEFTVPVTEVLNESGSRPLSDDEFIGRCLESCSRAEDTLDRIK